MKMSSTLFVPILSDQEAKPREARMAPALPTAAERPNAVVRTREGNTSAGMMNVVEFAPKLKKNCNASLQRQKIRPSSSWWL